MFEKKSIWRIKKMENVQVLKEQVLLGKEFRVYGTAEEPLFLAKDVASWIEHSNVSVMLGKVDEDEKILIQIGTLNNAYSAWFLTEDGLHEVLMQSRKPIAKEFKKEVKKILKEIRKTGGYIHTTPQDSEQDILAKAYIIAQNKINNLQQELKTVQPLIDYANVAQKQVMNVELWLVIVNCMKSLEIGDWFIRIVECQHKRLLTREY